MFCTSSAFSCLRYASMHLSMVSLYILTLSCNAPLHYAPLHYAPLHYAPLHYCAPLRMLFAPTQRSSTLLVTLLVLQLTIGILHHLVWLALALRSLQSSHVIALRQRGRPTVHRQIEPSPWS